jgi:tetratricopeptide (TPR) repeat protein
MTHRTFHQRLLVIPITLGALVAVAGCQQVRQLVSRGERSSDSNTQSVAPVVSGTGRRMPSSKLATTKSRDAGFASARAHEHGREFGKAATAYEGILKQHPDFSPAHHRLAIVYERLGKDSLAQKHFQLALTLAPENGDLLCDYGYSRYLRNDLENAEENFRAALALNPGLKRAHVNMGLIQARTGREIMALDSFRAAGCNESECRSNLAYGLMKEEKWGQAAQQLQVALSQNPSSRMLQERMQEVQAVLASGRTPKPNAAPAAMSQVAPASIPEDSIPLKLAPVVDAKSNKTDASLASLVGPKSNRLPPTEPIAVLPKVVEQPPAKPELPSNIPSRQAEVSPASFDVPPVIVEAP